MPIFKNGNFEDFPLWLYTNLKYPQSAINDSISGKVIARFKIDTLGMVSEIDIVRGVRDDLDQESIRVLSTSPNWIPARQGHRSVSIYYSVPIIFDINDQFFIKRIKALSKNAQEIQKSAQPLTGRYMSLPLRTARTFWLKRTVKWSAVRPTPAPTGDPLLVSRFLPTRE